MVKALISNSGIAGGYGIGKRVAPFERDEIFAVAAIFDLWGLLISQQCDKSKFEAP